LGSALALYAAFTAEALTAAFFALAFFRAALLAIAPAARFNAQRFLAAAIMFRLPAALSLRFGFGCSAGADTDSPCIFAHLAF